MADTASAVTAACATTITSTPPLSFRGEHNEQIDIFTTTNSSPERTSKQATNERMNFALFIMIISIARLSRCRRDPTRISLSLPPRLTFADK